MSKLTWRRDIVFRWVLLITAAGFLAHGVGYVLDDRAPQTIRLEGSTQWCLHSEYQNMKELKAEDLNAGNSFIDIGNSKVRVFTQCESI